MNHRRPSSFLTLAMLAVLAGALGCGDTFTGPPQGVTVQTIAPSQVAVANHTSESVFTFAVGRRASALVDWIPCVDGPGCHPIEHGTSRLQTVLVLQEMEETEAVVYWWRAVRRTDGTMRPDSIRAIVVKLQPGALPTR